jgi:hypothetical protein
MNEFSRIAVTKIASICFRPILIFLLCPNIFLADSVQICRDNCNSGKKCVNRLVVHILFDTTYTDIDNILCVCHFDNEKFTVGIVVTGVSGLVSAMAVVHLELQIFFKKI